MRDICLKHSSPQKGIQYFYWDLHVVVVFFYHYFLCFEVAFTDGASLEDGWPVSNGIDFFSLAFSQHDPLRQSRPTLVGKAAVGLSLVWLASGDVQPFLGSSHSILAGLLEKVSSLPPTSIKLCLVRTTRSTSLNWALAVKPRAKLHGITEKILAESSCLCLYPHHHHAQSILLYNLIFSDTTFQHN